MPDLVNPLAAYREAYGTLEGVAQDAARRRAGNALMGGDYQGAQNALYGRGMIDEGMGIQQRQMAVQDRDADRQQAAAAQEAELAKRALQMMGNTLEAMSRVPPEQRAEYFRTQVVPRLQGMPGATPEAIAEMSDPSYDWSDQGIATYRSLIGEAAQKLQVVPRGNGGYDVLDMGTGDPVRTVDPRAAEPERIEGPDGIYERDLQSGQWKKVATFGAAPRTFAPRRARRSGGGVVTSGPPRSYGSGSEPQW